MNEIKTCDYGCGLKGKFLLKNGKNCCSLNWISCLKVREKISLRMKEKAKITSKYNFSNYTNKKTIWNKGLNKDNNEKIKNLSEKIKKDFETGKRTPSFLGKHHTEESKRKLSKCGGIKQGAGRGKHGWYKDYWCDSSWELAWVIYNLEHNIKFERNTKGFEYQFNNQTFKYFPDFKLEDGTYIEIKGYADNKTNEKLSQFKEKLIILYYQDMKPYIEYVVNKYGKDFISLYKDYNKPNKEIRCIECQELCKGYSKLQLCEIGRAHV